MIKTERVAGKKRREQRSPTKNGCDLTQIADNVRRQRKILIIDELRTKNKFLTTSRPLPKLSTTYLPIS